MNNNFLIEELNKLCKQEVSLRDTLESSLSTESRNAIRTALVEITNRISTIRKQLDDGKSGGNVILG